MSNRKKRSRRHDPRSMTRDEALRHLLEVYKRTYMQAAAAYRDRHRNSPYTAIERLRYP